MCQLQQIQHQVTTTSLREVGEHGDLQGHNIGFPVLNAIERASEKVKLGAIQI
jgi:hypothetical protein